MARTRKEIYQAIIDDKETKASLNGLLPNPETSDQFTDDIDSGSKVALWRLNAWIIAFAIYVFEQVFDLHKAEVNEMINTRLAPSLPWYQSMCLEFQYGDNLAYIDNLWQYPTVTPANQIIEQCAVVENGRGLRIKVATDPGTGLEPLSATQLASFQAYLNKRKAPGTYIQVINEDPDLLKLDIAIYINTELINMAGELVADTTVRPVDDAINGYLETFTTVDFNGVFRITKLIDAIQAVPGVVDVLPRSIEWKYGALGYTRVEAFVTANAGYLALDPAYPLTDVAVIEYVEA